MKARVTEVMATTLLAGILAVFPQRGQADAPKEPEKPDEALVTALKGAEVIFTGKLTKVDPKGQTNSIPPSTFGTVTFGDVKALKGTAPEKASCSYSFRCSSVIDSGVHLL